MALQGGHRFAVSMDDVFPHGLYAMGVEQAQDFNEKTRARTPAKDKVTGESVWSVTCIDRDPDPMVRQKQVVVKVLALRCPDLPPEIVPGSGIRPVEFSGLLVTAYVAENGGRPRLAFSFRATGVHAQGKAPTGSASGRAGGPGMPAAGGAGDGKAA
jgi:hypothetical protein